MARSRRVSAKTVSKGATVFGHAAASLCILALTTACGPQQPRFLPPSDPPALQLGVTLGPERMTPRYLDQLPGRPLVLRVPVHSQAEAKDILQAVTPYPSLAVLLLVEQPDLELVAALAPLSHPQLGGIELCNECNLLNGETLYKFAAFISAAVEILTRAHWHADIVTGGLWLDDDPGSSLRYASLMLDSLPCEVAFGVHPYGETSDAALKQLRDAATCHRIAATEFGAHSINAKEDAAQVVYLREKLTALQRLGAAYALIYQLVSGPCGDTSNLGNFGLLDCHDAPKPALELLR